MGFNSAFKGLIHCLVRNIEFRRTVFKLSAGYGIPLLGDMRRIYKLFIPRPNINDAIESSLF